MQAAGAVWGGAKVKLVHVLLFVYSMLREVTGAVYVPAAPCPGPLAGCGAARRNSGPAVPAAPAARPLPPPP